MSNDAHTDPCRRFDLEALDGARLGACAHGGQVLSWCPAGGEERLWLSRDADCGPGRAVRGGIPVIWPQFSDRGPLPRHGLARDRAWSVRHAGTDLDGAAAVALVLRHDGPTLAVWPQPFELVLTARAAGARLAVSLTVTNLGDEAWQFTAALHTYLRLSDVRAATLAGLEGRAAEDNAAGGARIALPEARLPALGPVDVAVPGVAGPVVVHDGQLGDVVVEAEGLPDRVVWHPGSGRAPGDVHPGGEQEFVCVEPAVLSPVTLGGGETWTGRQVLTAG